MDSDNRDKLYIGRAKNELDLAKAIFKLSNTEELKIDFELKKDSTFFSNVICNSYYCIFYSAKGFLENRNIITKPPEEHKKTLEEFEKLALSGEIDIELLKIYKTIAMKAETLLSIFIEEKSKRGTYTYKKLPQANLEPAQESLNNAEIFLKNINLIIKNKSEENYKK